MKRIIIILMALLLNIGISKSLTEKNELHCDDFFFVNDIVVPILQFERCEIEQKQGVPMTAIYSVNGNDAKLIEAFLQDSVDLKPLNHTCCYWQSGQDQGFFSDANGRHYYVEMVSEETLLTQRNQWHEIPKFYVMVTTYSKEEEI